MGWRILLIVPVSLIVWAFLHNLARPDEYNWILWIMRSDASQTSKVIWGVICFAGTIVVLGSLALFARRSLLACGAVIVIAYVFANFIGTGFRTSGSPMTPEVFLTLALAMASSFPLTFSSMIAGKQVDLVGQGE